MKRNQTYNQLAVVSLILAAVVAVYYLLVFIFPQVPINPLRPVSINSPQVGLIATPTASNQSSLPPTWTPTPLSTALPLRPTLTAEPKSPTRTPAPTSTPTLNPLIPTRSPYKYTASRPVFMPDKYSACGNWTGVAGQVFNIDGSPLNGVSVVGWGGPVSEQDKRVFVSGSTNHINKVYGNGGYELFIGGAGDFDFQVVVYENGQPASAVIKLRMVNDCNRNLVLINFQRNH